MAGGRWQRLQELFDAALRLPPQDRADYLDRHSGDDPSLRGEVESLLRADEPGSGFIEGPVAGVAALLSGPDEPSDPASAPVGEHSLLGRRIGAYEVTCELGRGGMGTVYGAVRADDAFRKEVAIKVIRHGADDPALLRRFLAERQILATLDHPNIARLLDGGTTSDGLPYVVMERVQGEPLDRSCDAGSLRVDERLRLFLDVTAAVQYAHHNLVVHRDLKPANILVTAEGTPKLLDFGIAKLLDAGPGEGATATMLHAMTPAYASPEQVRGGPITTASDVYALGVILYELLTGQPPYRLEQRTRPEIERVICEQTPDKPSATLARGAEAASRARGLTPERLRRRLAGDLDTIVLKALRKEPTRRYASVEQLAEDLRRHLDGRPVIARPDTFRYRAGKFVRRHRAGVGALLAVAVLTAVYTARLARERDGARLEAAKAAQVAAFLQTLFRVSDPDESRGRTVTVRELLDRGAARIGHDLAAQPEAQADLMAVIGDVYLQLGLYDDATAQLEAALVTRNRIGKGEDAKAAGVLEALSVVKKVAGEYAASDALAGQAVALQRQLRGPPAALASSLNTLAEARRVRGDYPAAESFSREALALRRSVLPPEHRDIADNLNNLALLIQARGDYGAAEGMHRESLAMRRRVLGEDHPEVSNSLNNLAVTLAGRGDYAAAEGHYREALALRRRILGEDEPRTLNTARNLGALLVEKGDEAAAEPVLRAALERMRGRLDADHPYADDARMSLALALSARGAHRSAAVMAEDALTRYRRHLGDRHPDTLRAMARLARVKHGAGDRAAARQWFHRALEGQRGILPAGHPSAAETLAGLGAALLEDGEAAAAEPLLREALALASERLLPGHVTRAEASAALGVAFLAQGRHAEAEPLLVAAHEGFQASRGSGHPSTMSARQRLVQLYESWGRPSDAARYRVHPPPRPAPDATR
jgi:serine/threonine-protein kinase